MLDNIADLIINDVVEHIEIDDKELSDTEHKTFQEIKEQLPKDKENLIFKYEETITQRERLKEEAVYKKGFRQGAKLIIEILNEESGEKPRLEL